MLICSPLCRQRAQDVVYVTGYHEIVKMARRRVEFASTLVAMRVAFFVHDPAKRIVGWQADLGKRRRVPGTLMGYGRDMPHDLAQYVIEAATGYEHGFWGLLAMGATFKSIGHRRTRPGRSVIADHRDELRASEHLASREVAFWRAGVKSPVTVALDRTRAQWKSLPIGDVLVFEWPSERGQIEHAV
jgi:hypothetical protein